MYVFTDRLGIKLLLSGKECGQLLTQQFWLKYPRLYQKK